MSYDWKAHTIRDGDTYEHMLANGRLFRVHATLGEGKVEYLTETGWALLHRIDTAAEPSEKLEKLKRYAEFIANVAPYRAN